MCDGLILLIIQFKEFSYSLSCSVSFPLQKCKEGKALVRYHSVTTERRQIWPKADSLPVRSTSACSDLLRHIWVMTHEEKEVPMLSSPEENPHIWRNRAGLSFTKPRFPSCHWKVAYRQGRHLNFQNTCLNSLYTVNSFKQAVVLYSLCIVLIWKITSARLLAVRYFKWQLKRACIFQFQFSL